jgi:hypothetical protein
MIGDANDPATHPIARAASRAGRGTDAVIVAERVGRALDARVAAVGTLTTRTELETLVHDALDAASQHYGGKYPGLVSWQRNVVAQARARAIALGLGAQAWVLDLHGPDDQVQQR